jgi:hypothetical protein
MHFREMVNNKHHFRFIVGCQPTFPAPCQTHGTFHLSPLYFLYTLFLFVYTCISLFSVLQSTFSFVLILSIHSLFVLILSIHSFCTFCSIHSLFVLILSIHSLFVPIQPLNFFLYDRTFGTF